MFGSKRRDSVKSGSPNVFISYSRKDSLLAETLAKWLERHDVKVLIDRNDIAAAEEWKRRLSDLIESADAVVFVVSFASVTSEVCRWEIARAEELRKRIIPILRDAVPDRDLPAGLAKINYIPFLDAQTVEDSFANLVAAINVDIAWVREHTRLGQIAGRWEGRGRASALLLRGHELSEAERWMEQRPGAAPVPTDSLLAFLQASRRGSTRRQRLAVGAAMSVATVTAALAVAAYVQRGEAIAQKDAAEQAREVAERSEQEAAQQRVSAQRSQSRYLADLSAQHAKRGEHETAALLALEAMPDPDDAAPRPVVPEARQALYEAIWGQRVVAEWRGAPMSELLAPVNDVIQEYVAHQAKIENDKLAGKPEPTGDAERRENGERDMDTSRPSWLPSMFRNLKPESLKSVRDLRNVVGEYFDKVLGSFVRGAALSPDGEQVAIDLANGSVLVMDAQTRKVVRSHACDPVTDDREMKELAHSGGIESQVGWSTDGTITVRRKPFPGAGSRSAAPVCMFTPDGKGRMVVERSDRYAVIDTTTGKELLAHPLKPQRELTVRAGRGTTHLVLEVAGEKGVLVWDVLAGKQTARMEPQVPTLLPQLDHSWNIDGKWLCARGVLIDASTGKQIAALNLPGYRVHRCTVNAPTERVATLSLSPNGERGVVALWNARTGGLLFRHDLQISTAPTPPPANSAGTGPRGADLGPDLDELKEALEETRIQFDSTGRFASFSTPQAQWRFIDVRTGATAFEMNGRDAGTHGILSQLAWRIPRWEGGLKPMVDGARTILDRIKLSGEAIRNYAFHPTRPLMAVARFENGHKGTVQIWELERRALLQTLSGMEAENLHAAFSSDGQRLMVYDSDLLAAKAVGVALHRLWVWGEIPVGKETLHGASLPFGSERRWELRLDLSKLLDFQSAINMSTASERILAVRDFGFGLGVMSTAAVGRNVALIDTGAQPPRAAAISELAFAKDGKSIAAIQGSAAAAWDTSVPTPRRLVMGQNAVALAPDAPSPAGAVLPLGQRLPTANHKLWDVEGQRTVEMPDTKSVAVVDVGGGRVVMAADGGDYFVAALDRLETRVKLQVPEAVAMLGRAQVAEEGVPGFTPVVRMSPTGKRAVVSDTSGGAGIYDTTTGARIATLEIVTDKLGVKIDETMKLVSTGGKKLGRYLSTASFSPDGRLLAGAWLADVQATVWEVETGRAVARQKENNGRVALVAFSPDGKVVATATDAPVVRLWQADTGDHALTLNGHADGVTAMAFDRDGARIATASRDGSIRLWKLFASDAELVRFTRQTMPRCLAEGQRLQFFVSADPPAWCKQLGKPTTRAFEPLLLSLGITSYESLGAMWTKMKGSRAD